MDGTGNGQQWTTFLLQPDFEMCKWFVADGGAAGAASATSVVVESLQPSC